MKRGAPTRFGVRLAWIVGILFGLTVVMFMTGWGTGDEIRRFWLALGEVPLAFFYMVTPG